MKNHAGSNLLISLSIVALLYALVQNPPGGVHWEAFFADPSTNFVKFAYLLRAYLLPALLAFLAISLFQLQFRLAAGGATKRAVFAICVLASGAMLLALRSIAFTPNSAPAYVTGMASGYTMMSRLYAITLREIARGLRIPWPVWRGNLAAVAELDRILRERQAARQGANLKA